MLNVCCKHSPSASSGRIAACFESPLGDATAARRVAGPRPWHGPRDGHMPKINDVSGCVMILEMEHVGSFPFGVVPLI